MLTLSRRIATLGGDQSSKVKDKDGEKVRTMTFEIQEFPLDEAELNAFLRDPKAYNFLYTEKNGEVEPVQTCFKSHEMREAIPNAYVEVHYGMTGKIIFTDCKLTKIKLATQTGGETLLSCKVTTAPILDETLSALFERFGDKVQFEIRGEPPGAQQDLPLNKAGEAERKSEGDKARKRGNGGRGGRGAWGQRH